MRHHGKITEQLIDSYLLTKSTNILASVQDFLSRESLYKLGFDTAIFQEN